MRIPTTNAAVLTAQIMGRKAARAGMGAAMCPYPHYTLMHLQWLQGWCDEKEAMERRLVGSPRRPPNP